MSLISSNTIEYSVADAYTLHLADVHSVCGVYTSQDIYNSKNELIVEKQLPFSASVALMLLRKELLAPLESSIDISRVIDAAILEKYFVDIIYSDAVFSALHEQNDFISAVKKQCQLYDQYPLLQQKITVMAHAMPKVYERTLFCCLLSLLIAQEMRLSEKDIHLVFLSALSHDIGMLHIDSAILNRQSLRSSDDWLKVQHHVVIGAKFLQSIHNIPTQVAQAVLEHHERCDGTGYPKGIVESEIEFFGQIIGFTDSVVAIYFNQFKAQGKSWRNVVPIIQMNMQAYLHRNFEIWDTILRRSELPAKNVVNSDATADFILEIMQKNERLQLWFEVLKASLLSLGFTHGDRRLHSLQNIMLHISTAVKGSTTFVSQTYLLGFDAAEKTGTNNVDVNAMLVMNQEILFHLQRLTRMTQLYIESDESKNNDIKAVLTLGLHNANKVFNGLS